MHPCKKIKNKIKMQTTTSVVNPTGHVYLQLESFLLINSTLFPAKVSIRESRETSELVLLFIVH